MSRGTLGSIKAAAADLMTGPLWAVLWQSSGLMGWLPRGMPQGGSAALLMVWETISEVGTGAKNRPPVSASVLRRTESSSAVGEALVGEGNLTLNLRAQLNT